MRVFLDTNVLVSAFATRGLSSDVFEVVCIEHELIAGRRMLEELQRVLGGKLKVSATRCAEAVELVAQEATLVVKDAPPAKCKADADDCAILGEALAGRADTFVTGDAALLELQRVGPMRVMSPRQFWELLQKQ